MQRFHNYNRIDDVISPTSRDAVTRNSSVDELWSPTWYGEEQWVLRCSDIMSADVSTIVAPIADRVVQLEHDHTNQSSEPTHSFIHSFMAPRRWMFTQWVVIRIVFVSWNVGFIHQQQEVDLRIQTRSGSQWINSAAELNWFGSTQMV